MTLDHALRLLAMTVDTITALQQQIDALTAENHRLQGLVAAFDQASQDAAVAAYHPKGSS
jgi:FtsZ-binding cell division protein ZapB